LKCVMLKISANTMHSHCAAGSMPCGKTPRRCCSMCQT
jgi:hypothetical protein